jgi:dTDP-D-glucose 4,6-dehydratase
MDVNKINKMGWKAQIDMKVGVKKTVFEYKNLNNDFR